MQEKGKPLKVLELFAGVGTFSLALKKLGVPYEIVDAVEIDKYAMQAFNVIHGTKFPAQDISQWDKDIEVDMITHGSPCQSFSVAGKGAGGDEGSGTTSSLMWETVRIVEKLLPKYVIWENVKNILSKKHRHNFDAYLKKMESLGYKNFYQVMNAKDYGVPQNRERVFTVSILNGGDFKFPEPVPLKKKLKDILEKNPDEKYYLSDEKASKLKLKDVFSQKGIKKVGDLDIKGQDQIKRVYSPDGVSPTLSTMQGGQRQPKIIDPQGRRDKICVPREIAPTLRAQTHGNEPCVIDDTYGYENAPREYTNVVPTLRSGRQGLKMQVPFIAASRGRNPDNPSDKTAGIPTGQRLEPKFDGTSNTLTSVAKDNYLVESPSRIRCLTPLECWRLQGHDDADFKKAKKSGLSDSQLYKIAGNGIAKPCLEAIFRELFRS